MPQDVIDRVHVLARRSGANAGLEFWDRHNQIIEDEEDEDDDDTYVPELQQEEIDGDSGDEEEDGDDEDDDVSTQANQDVITEEPIDTDVPQADDVAMQEGHEDEPLNDDPMEYDSIQDDTITGVYSETAEEGTIPGVA